MSIINPLDTETLLEYPPPRDLDSFFQSIYEFHFRGGAYGLMVAPVSQIALHVFVMVITGISIFNIDYDGLINASGDEVHLSDFFHRPTSIASIFYGITCGIYLIWRIANEVRRIPRRLSTRNFYRDILNIDIESKWSDVVSRISDTQLSGNRIVLNTEILTPLYVAKRALRMENYIVLIVENNLLGCHIDEIVLWHVWMLLVQPLFPKDSWRFTSDAEGFRKRCRMFLALNIVFMPFVLLLLSVYFLLKAAEMGSSPAIGIESRYWSLEAQWKLRNYNEYPHQLQTRLEKCKPYLIKYLDQTPRPVTRRCTSLVKFVSGSLIGCITITTLLNDDALTDFYIFDRPLLWWGGILGAVFAISKAFQPRYSECNKTLAEKYLIQVRKHLGLPLNASDKETREKLDALCPLFIKDWRDSILNVIYMPVILWRWANNAYSIMEKLENNTIFGTRTGDICVNSIMVTSPNETDTKSSMSFRSFRDEYIETWDLHENLME